MSGVTLQNRWFETWAGFGSAGRADLEAEYQKLIQAYGESHRFYHNRQHLQECFHYFEWVRHEADHPTEIQLAIWYHDSVYDPTRDDNEWLSAQWAARSLKALGMPLESVERIRAMILATADHRGENDSDTQRLLDIDLSILGASYERFQQYERQIRQEYAWVPEVTYRAKRRAVLEDFLSRESLYGCHVFQERLQKQARENIGRLLESL